jgi:hypothetical protein
VGETHTTPFKTYAATQSPLPPSRALLLNFTSNVDSNGVLLAKGDTVVLIKDLPPNAALLFSGFRWLRTILRILRDGSMGSGLSPDRVRQETLNVFIMCIRFVELAFRRDQRDFSGELAARACTQATSSTPIEVIQPAAKYHKIMMPKLASYTKYAVPIARNPAQMEAMTSSPVMGYPVAKASVSPV